MEMLSILDSVDSTNNYAMGKVHAGLASHGDSWFSKEQTAGKGQRGKTWNSRPGENILMSTVIQQNGSFQQFPFVFNALVANACFRFLSVFIENELAIKWPNDIYIGDRKAGGLLIENIYKGSRWLWSVVGIGININQVEFDGLANPVSVKQVTGTDLDTIILANQLRGRILSDFAENHSAEDIMMAYNSNLYKLGNTVKLKKNNAIFETVITGVNQSGHLLTLDNMVRHYAFGEVEMVFDKS